MTTENRMIIPLLVSLLLLAAPSTVFAQTETQPSRIANAFYQLINGKWAQVSKNAHNAITDTQINIAALQCHAARKIKTDKATNISSISNSISQKLSRIVIYQKLQTGLNRIELGTRLAILLPKLNTGNIRGGNKGFEISNETVKITISFARFKQGNKSVPVMIEGKALYLKCPE